MEDCVGADLKKVNKNEIYENMGISLHVPFRDFGNIEENTGKIHDNFDEEIFKMRPEWQNPVWVIIPSN